MSSPTLLSTPAGPAVTHSSDFSLVTASNPATPNELLTLFCTGLLPSIEAPSTPFPTSPLTTLDSPVAVTINGEAAQVLGTVGFPGSTNGYQINIRVPGDTQAGTAALQVSAAWIPGPSVNISVQPAK